MAYESEMIAAQNNPVTLLAWRRASWLRADRDYWRASANRWQKIADERFDSEHAYAVEARNLKRKLEAAQAENVAVHKDLGGAYESIRIRDMRFLDDVGQYSQEAARWKRIASRLQISLMTLLGAWLVVVQALLLGRL